ncbi:C6 transcription factor [Pochonia chlamydosporia 170]|uniref:C6 transcription factor n=1 Tax=Pochonia chlamydosporia 170 TaxID=1380566 RepID=A0A179FJ33_METCM|nr:C6 transcription factor [Pochonia chlamydosporia 170]OAQ65033.1 C6 transcription factor [Pochonia chlamydosporia 170]
MEPKPGAPRLRRLLPATGGGQPLASPEQAVRRKNITTACGACRKRKSKCDGARPICHPCIRKRSACEYTSQPHETQLQALKRRYSELERTKSARDELYDILRICSDRDAEHILQKIRTGISPDSLLRCIKEADMLLQVTLPPETRFRYDFPIVKTFPRSLENEDNLYLTQSIFQAKFNVGPQRASPAGSPYQKPYHAAHVVERKLDDLNVSRWTSVTSNNTLIRNLLRDYFLHEYPYFPPFQKDHFLGDMAAGSTRFCSELLVNAVLARACQNCDMIQNRANFWDPDNLYYKFFAETKRLWELADKDGAVELTTIQAAILIDLSYRVNGLDKIGSTYLRQAVAMAEVMQLLNTFPNDMDMEERNARDFTAWCLFSYQVCQTYYFFQKPLTNTRPMAPLPDPAQSRDWYGEIWVKYPADDTIYATHFGYSFKAMVELHALMGDIAFQAFSIPGEITKLSYEEALMHQSKLDSWFSRLPATLSPSNAVFPNQLKVHLEFHRTVWTLLDTFSEVATASGQRGIMTASVHFETIMRLYFLRHSYAFPDSFMMLFMVTLGFISIERLTFKENQAEINEICSIILLCARGLYEQSLKFYVAETLLHLTRGKMGQGTLDMLGAYVPAQRDIDLKRCMAARLNRSELPMTAAKSGKDLTLVKMESMIKEFEDL